MGEWSAGLPEDTLRTKKRNVPGARQHTWDTQVNTPKEMLGESERRNR